MPRPALTLGEILRRYGDAFRNEAAAPVATRWVSNRWGVAARGLIGLGGVLRGTTTDIERRHPSYFQMLVRYRAVDSGRSGLHVGIGGGLWGYIQDSRFDFGPHFLGLEALGSRALGRSVQCIYMENGWIQIAEDSRPAPIFRTDQLADEPPRIVAN